MALNLKAIFLSALFASFAEVHSNEDYIKTLSYQNEILQFRHEESVRQAGWSGVMNQRLRHNGVDNFQTETSTGRSVNALHDHADYPVTPGLGEIAAVLNGVLFRTRHNDYRIVQPSKSSKTLHAVDPIDLPEVPESVKSKGSVAAQIEEMRMYFKAWLNQNVTLRNYLPFFRPVLCYLEGAWYKSEMDIVEVFNSKRHTFDAAGYSSLMERDQYYVYNGGKHLFENLAFLPKAFMGETSEGKAQEAQWNYRILCHPIKGDVPFDYMLPMEDLSARMFRGNYEFGKFVVGTRAVRFTFKATETQTYGQYQFGILDKLMREIPGLDNYPGKITSDARILKPETTNNEILNTAYYHRLYKTPDKDASGMKEQHRGYNDPFLFAAQTTQDAVVGRNFTPDCRVGKTKAEIKPDCEEPTQQKWSWAIPLEVIYLTPLQSWNPHQVTIKDDWKEMTDSNTLSGNQTHPWKGAFPEKGYYITPKEFFVIEEDDAADPADTVKEYLYVKDKHGVAKAMKASGIYCNLPKIHGINGRPRIRYPVYPVHEEGSNEWKQLNALRMLVMNNDTLGRYLHPRPKEPAVHSLKLQTSKSTDTSGHSHTIDIGRYDLLLLKGNQQIAVTTNRDGQNHVHKMEIIRRIRPNGTVAYYLKVCDGNVACRHGHDKIFE